MSTGIKAFLRPESCAVAKNDNRHTPVKIEIVTEEDEAFTVAFTREAWTLLILGGAEVDGWIEPIEVDPDLRVA